VTAARVVAVIPSVDEARVFLAQARRFATDASTQTLSGTSRQLLLYQSCIAACDAALVAVGKAIEGSEGAHALRFDEATTIMSLDDDLLDALNAARQIRGGSAYRAGVVTSEDVADAADTTDQLLAEVEMFVDQASDQRSET